MNIFKHRDALAADGYHQKMKPQMHLALPPAATKRKNRRCTQINADEI